MQTIRFCFDKVMRASVKLAMLTGVTFTMTACYGVVPSQYADDEAYQTDTQQMEQILVVEEEEVAN
jgi:hypothetical protein